MIKFRAGCPRIDGLWAFLSVDENGRESVCAMQLLGHEVIVPMIAADRERLDSLIPVAEEIAAKAGCVIRLVRFAQRDVITEFKAGE